MDRDNPLETSLANVGFTADANEDETASSTAVATEEPETAEETATEETAEETREEGSEETSEEATSETSEEDTEATEEEQPQGYDLMLPNQQLKNYPDELYQLAAKKFGVDQTLLEHKSVKDLLKGKIDADIDNRNLRDRLDTGAEDDDDTIVDEEEAPAAARAERTETVTPQRQLEATYNLLRGGLDGNTPIVTKEGAKLYSSALTDSYTEMQAALESGDEKKIEAASVKLTETHAAFATTMFANVFPMLLPHMLQQLPSEIWDGIVGGKLEQREEMKETHSTARTELARDPRYADLPEMIKSKAIYNFVKENPEVLEKRFVDQQGRTIKDPVKLEMARYRYVVHQIRGQNYRPPTELVKKGMAAGKRQADSIAEKKANGRISTGRTRGTVGSATDKYDPKNWADRMKRAADNSNPLGAFLENSK